MTTSTDTVLEKAEARLQFHDAEAQKHIKARNDAAWFIDRYKSYRDEPEAPAPDVDEKAAVAPQIAPPVEAGSLTVEEPKPAPTIRQRVADQFEKTPHLHVKEVAELLDLSPQQIYTTQGSLGIKFGQPAKWQVNDDPPPTIRERVKALHSEAPELSYDQAAARLGLTRVQVYNASIQQGFKFGETVSDPNADDEADEPEPQLAEEEETPAPIHINGARVQRVPIPRHTPTGKYAAGTKFYLRDKDSGKYLHQDLNTMIMNKGELHLVDAKTYAWCGPESKLINVRRALPDTMDLVEEPVINL